MMLEWRQLNAQLQEQRNKKGEERDAQISATAESFETKKGNSKLRGLIRKKLRNSYFVTKIEIHLKECTSINQSINHSFIYTITC